MQTDEPQWGTALALPCCFMFFKCKVNQEIPVTALWSVLSQAESFLPSSCTNAHSRTGGTGGWGKRMSQNGWEPQQREQHLLGWYTWLAAILPEEVGESMLKLLETSGSPGSKKCWLKLKMDRFSCYICFFLRFQKGSLLKCLLLNMKQWLINEVLGFQFPFAELQRILSHVSREAQ